MLRETILKRLENWSFAPSDWEQEVVADLLALPRLVVPRASSEQLKWARMPGNECHANVRWYVKNDPSKRTKISTGWWVQWPNFVSHSVLEQDQGFICITPSLGGESEIDYIPDPAIEWRDRGEHFEACRKDRALGMGVRRFPELTMAINDAVRQRLESGMDPYVAMDIGSEAIGKLEVEYLSEDERKELHRGLSGR